MQGQPTGSAFSFPLACFFTGTGIELENQQISKWSTNTWYNIEKKNVHQSADKTYLFVEFGFDTVLFLTTKKKIITVVFKE